MLGIKTIIIMATYAIGGVEKIELAPAFFTQAGLATAVWVRALNVVEDTTLYTENSDTETEIVPADSDSAFLFLATPGEADQVQFGLLELHPTIQAMLYNQEYVATTSTTTMLAKRKVANLAIKITTRSIKDGRKQTVVIPNVFFRTAATGNYNKTSAVQILITGKVSTFKTTTTLLDAKSIRTWITDAGAVIDSTTP